jgi:hypothetical protein
MILKIITTLIIILLLFSDIKLLKNKVKYFFKNKL